MYTGTNHFISLKAAIRYYKDYDIDEMQVEQKINEGSIIIGKPEAKPGQKIVLDQREGRYLIFEKC